MLFILFVLIWAFFIEPNLLIVKRITINDSDLQGIRVAYLSDLHLYKGSKNYYLNLVKKVNNEKPDIILLGGDYVVIKLFKHQSMNLKEITDILEKLKANYGVYMIMGNHEAFGNILKKIHNHLKGSNIKILQNTSTKLKIKNKNIYLVGIGDYASHKDRIDLAFREAKKPIIAFTHSPDIFPQIPDYVNITFAGHTHGGQVYLPLYGPVTSPRHLLGLYIKGLYTNGNKKMYVSSGIGSTHLKVRLFNLPEILIVDFK